MAFAAVFPGQGSQSVGMLAELGKTCPDVAAIFAEASDALDYDLSRVVAEGPAEELNRTETTQPALLAAGIAVWRCWLRRGGVPPAVAAGHSLGEYTALVAAGALDFAAAVRLVRLRGQFMQQAVPDGTGAMAAILGLDADGVKRICSAAAEVGLVAPANYNSPEQIVISGEREAVERAGELARAAGAKRVIGLAVSVPSHCALMQPATGRFAAVLAEVPIRPPTFPVLNNVDVNAPDAPQSVRDALLRQLTHPVRWTETVAACASRYGVTAVAEFGPGKVLTGLVRRINRGLSALPVFDSPSLEAGLAALPAG